MRRSAKLTAQYCFYVMTRQRTKVPALFADDASFTGNAGSPTHGKEAIRKMFASSDSITLIPFTHNIIELSGNRASGTCAVEVRAVQNEVAMTAADYYNDRCVKVGEE